MTAEQRVALVTGANRGLGLETARQLAQQNIRVIIGSRDPEQGEAAAAQLKQQGGATVAHPLDVTNEDSIKKLSQFLESEFGRVDILVNNAGIMPDRSGGSVFSTELESIREAMETNVYGPILLAQTLVPAMKQQNYGRIVNVSSGLGQLAEMGGGYTAYRLSKTALNAATRILADEVGGSNIKVNAVCPGWVQTDMGGPNAPRTPEQGADTIAWLATLPDDAPSGLFWRDRTPIPW
ncbi:MAG TPA: SDR family oxidoreductase [Leptolyngbyaceae cyanobacterium]